MYGGFRKTFRTLGFPSSSAGKESTCNTGDPSLIPGSGRFTGVFTPVFLGFPCSSAGKESACNVVDLSSIPGLERSPGEWKGYPLRCSGLDNSMDRTWDLKESDTTERLSLSLHFQVFKKFSVWLLQWPSSYLVAWCYLHMFVGFFAFISWSSFLISYCCGWKECLIWFQSSYIYSNLFCGLSCDLSWRIFHVYSRKMCVLLILNGKFCIFISIFL